MHSINGTHTNIQTDTHTPSLSHTLTHPPGLNNQAPSIRTNSHRLSRQAPSLWKPSLYSKPVLSGGFHTQSLPTKTSRLLQKLEPSEQERKETKKVRLVFWHFLETRWDQHEPTQKIKRWGFWSSTTVLTFSQSVNNVVSDMTAVRKDRSLWHLSNKNSVLENWRRYTFPPSSSVATVLLSNILTS